MFKGLDERGSAAAMAIIAMLFLGIVIAGLLPMLTQELRAGQLDRDQLQARYVAEAGVKHALVLFKNAPNSVASLQNNPQYFQGDNNKRYTVTFSPQIVGSPTAGTTYSIVSTGTLGGNLTWTARDTYTMPGNPPSSPGNNLPSDFVMYAQNLVIKNNTAINGNIGLGSAVPAGINGSGTRTGNLNLAYPSYDFNKFKVDAAPLPALKQNMNLTGKYYIDGDWNINLNNLSVNGNYAIIFVNGNINVTVQNVNFTGQVMIIATGSFNAPDVNNLSFSNAVIVTGGDFITNNTSNINGAVFIHGTAEFKNNTNINYDKNLVDYYRNQMTPYL